MAQNSARLKWSSEEVDEKLKGIMEACKSNRLFLRARAVMLTIDCRLQELLGDGQGVRPSQGRRAAFPRCRREHCGFQQGRCRDERPGEYWTFVCVD